MQVTDAIRQRRSIKKFTARPITREEIEQLLDAAVLAPNHKLSEPWRFYVLGPASRRAYGEVLGGRKAKKVEDAQAARAIIEKIGAEHAALPGMIVVAMTQSDDPERREEDYAAVMMAVQNMLLAAVQLGLGSHIKTGAVMNDPAARAAIGIPDDQRIVAAINVGEVEEAPQQRVRSAAPERTTWLP